MTVNSLCNAGKYPKLYNIHSTELSLCYRPCNDAMAPWSTALCHITCRCLYLHSGMPHFAAWSDRQSLTVFPFRCSHPPICSQRGSSILQIAGVSDWLAQSNHTVWDLPRIYRSQIWSHPPISIAYRPKVLIGLS